MDERGANSLEDQLAGSVEKTNDVPCSVRLSRLHKSFLRSNYNAQESRPPPRTQLLAAAEPFGCTGEVVIFWSSHAALVSMRDASSAQAMVSHYEQHPLILGGHPVQMRVCADVVEPLKVHESMWSEAATQRECSSCLDAIIRAVEKEEHKENAAKRLARRKTHYLTLSELFKDHVFIRETCWQQQRTMNGCRLRDTSCFRSHVTTPFCCVPFRMRSFMEEETYPAGRREGSKQKMAVNEALAALASTKVSMRRALILDGPGGATVRTLVSQQWRPEHLLVPNLCTDTYLTLKKSQQCVPFLGSLRACLDSLSCPYPEHRQLWHSAEEKEDMFGLVYADYCCSLYANVDDVELNPVHDLKCLFTTGKLAHTSVLAVTLARPDDDKVRPVVEVERALGESLFPNVSIPPEDSQVLEKVVDVLAARNNFRSEVVSRFDYEKTFVRIWLLSKKSDSPGASNRQDDAVKNN